MRFSRRNLLRTGAAGLAGTALLGTASANQDWQYSLTSVAPVPGATDIWLDDGWAYVANHEGLVTVDLSNPSSPSPGGYASGGRDTRDNRDVKVAEPEEGEYEKIASLANNAGNGGTEGVTFYDVSEESDPKQIAFYEADDGVHNHDIDGDYAYLTISPSEDASFSEARMQVIDIHAEDGPKKVGKWRLRDYREDMALAGTNPLHDVYVQDGYAFMSFWKAGTVVADVTEPTEPRAVAHFAAHEEATKPQSDDFVEYFGDYAGDPENSHTTKPTPDREYTLVGTEVYPEPTGTAWSDIHGGIRVFHTPFLTRDPDKLDSIEPLMGEVDNEGGDKNPRTKTARADPYAPGDLDLVRAPENPQDGVRTAHNFSLTNDKVFTSWYQAGVRAYDLSGFRDDDKESSMKQIAEFDPPAGDAYWTALNLESAREEDTDPYYTVGSDIGKGLHVLELSGGGDGSSSEMRTSSGL
jgi:hypothetical protein